MRSFALGGFLLLAMGYSLLAEPADTNGVPASAVPQTNFDEASPAAPQAAALHQAWLAEHDPAKRHDIGSELVDAVIHEDDPETELVDEVARDGALKNELKLPTHIEAVKLVSLKVLNGVQADPDHYPPSPVFRRITEDRVEAWTSAEGWLFDQKGKTVADVQVPRRGGDGREWYGAFLKDGTWITTDIWGDDQQLNSYTPDATWKWEFPGDKILGQLPKPKANPDTDGEAVRPSIGWARADKTGKRWLVSLGTDLSRAFALVSPSRQVIPVQDGANLWHEVYPRAMGPRGMYTSLSIPSDDAQVTFHRGEASHGTYVGWPTYDLSSNDWSVVICGENEVFGFWPQSHDVFLESDGLTANDPHRVWFFRADGKYAGEVAGSYLADAANGHDLLVQDAEGWVLQVSRAGDALTMRNARSFTWPDGSRAVPLAIFDDLKLGFFLRGPGMSGSSDASRKARAQAEVVLAKW